MRDETLSVDGLQRCESAVQGLRKQYLPRSWENRCADCGLRFQPSPPPGSPCDS